MSDLTVTAAQVALIDPSKATLKDYLAGSAITKGQLVAMDTDGTIDPADSTDGSSDYLFEQVQGIALNGGGAGQAIVVCQDGELAGMGVSGLNAGAFVYASEVAGKIGDASAGVTVYVGRVHYLTDKDTTPVLRVQTIFSEAKPTA